MASFVSVVVEGNLDAFREDDRVELRMTTEPLAANGWRSEHFLESAEGGRPATVARVTLVSVFARRNGPSNTSIEAACMPEAASGTPDRASRHLKARARSFHDLAASTGSDAPIASLPVIAGSDFDGVGLLYFANFLRFLELAEARALEGPWTLPPIRRREIHYFGNADDSETLDLFCDVHVERVSPCASIAMLTTVRRRSDGLAIAMCDARRGA